MTQTTLNKTYSLSRDNSHLVDVDTDAWLVKFPGAENVHLSILREYDLPERIEFDAIFDVIQTSDFPINDVGWPIMSKKMLNTLLSVGNFPHKAIPVVMVDCEVISYESGAAKRSEKENHCFVAVQLLEHLDAFDWEKSVYEPHPRMSNRVSYIKKLVFKEPTNAFPPLFRLSARPSPLFVSGKARAALEKEGIQGVIFQDLEEFQG